MCICLRRESITVGRVRVSIMEKVNNKCERNCLRERETEREREREREEGAESKRKIATYFFSLLSVRVLKEVKLKI